MRRKRKRSHRHLHRHPRVFKATCPGSLVHPLRLAIALLASTSVRFRSAQIGLCPLRMVGDLPTPESAATYEAPCLKSLILATCPSLISSSLVPDSILSKATALHPRSVVVTVTPTHTSTSISFFSSRFGDREHIQCLVCTWLCSGLAIGALAGCAISHRGMGPIARRAPCAVRMCIRSETASKGPNVVRPSLVIVIYEGLAGKVSAHS
jgi:hypothetical protein